MQITIGCTDGHTYVSDYIPDDEIKDALEQADGKIGNGAWSDRVFSFDDYVQMIRDMVYKEEMDGEKVNYATLSLAMDGKERDFKVQHIVWMDIVLEETDS